MTALEVFTQGDTAVRTKMIDGVACILLGDIVNAIGLKSTPAQVAQRLPDGVRRMDTIEDRLGRTQRATFITEAGLYRVVMRCDNLAATEPFIEWVTGEVLPAIRRTGSYSTTPAEPVTPALPQSYADALRELASTVEAKELATARAEQAEAQVAVAAPKVEAFDAFMDADGTYSMAAGARMLGMSRPELFKRLRAEAIFQKGENLPYRPYDKYFFMRPGTRPDGNGGTVATLTPKLRPEAIDWLRRRLRAEVLPSGLVALAGGA